MLSVVQHTWKTTTFLTPNLCSYCGELIWGFTEQGVQCTKCNFVSHHKCKNSVVSSCHIAEPHPIIAHTFLPFKLRRATFCNFCRTVITIINPGLKCDVCRYIVHPECAEPAPKNCRNGLCSHTPPSSPPNSLQPLSPPPSSSASSSTSPPPPSKPPLSPSPSPDALQTHHWVEGNAPQKGVCNACGLGCTNTTVIFNFRCAWCKHLAHSACLAKINPLCDGGDLRNSLILPKAAVAPVAPSTVVELIDDELPPSPMFVFVNSKSGGQQGPRLLHKLRYLLNNAVQVFELIPNGPGPGLDVIQQYLNDQASDSEPNLVVSPPTKTFTIAPPKGKLAKLRRKRTKKTKKEQKNGEWYQGIRIVVCGGDGTAGWLVSAMAERGMSVPLAIIPLGTGNDLARTLGWGPGYNGENVINLLKSIEQSALGTLDRWTTEFTAFSGKKESKTMTNYFSIGVDAKVALSFHMQREASPEQFKNRFVNFLWYTKFGATAMFDGCENLSQEIKLEVDEKSTEIPPKLQGLIVVNLPSYAAGLNMWKGDTPEGTQKQAIDDGLLEVVGVMGSAHIGQIQTGLSDCVKITQGKTIKITFIKPEGHYPVQVDGEPWSQEPATIFISRRDQVPVLIHQDHIAQVPTSPSPPTLLVPSSPPTTTTITTSTN